MFANKGEQSFNPSKEKPSDQTPWLENFTYWLFVFQPLKGKAI